jgi:hypothetical protein
MQVVCSPLVHIRVHNASTTSSLVTDLSSKLGAVSPVLSILNDDIKYSVRHETTSFKARAQSYNAANNVCRTPTVVVGLYVLRDLLLQPAAISFVIISMRLF